MQQHIGDEFTGVVTGVTNFGIFVQISQYLVDGLIRYEHLMDDWWDVNERAGQVHGQRTGVRIRIGDVVKVIVVRVDLARRELDLSISQLSERSRGAPADQTQSHKKKGKRGAHLARRDAGHKRHGRDGQRRQRARGRR
jgi:ribonuclease R